MLMFPFEPLRSFFSNGTDLELIFPGAVLFLFRTIAE